MAKFISNLYLRWYLRNESEKARQIAIERPKLWEYLLTEQLLNDWLRKWKPSFHDEQSVKGSGSVFTNQIEFQIWAILQGVKVLDASFTMVLPFLNQELSAAWGPRGEPGDAVRIRKAIVKLDKMCLEMIGWQRDIASAKFPIRRETIRALMMDWRKYPLELIDQFKRELTTMLTDDPQLVGNHMLTVGFHNLPKWDEFNEELNRVTDSLPESEKYLTQETMIYKAEADRLSAKFPKRTA